MSETFPTMPLQVSELPTSGVGVPWKWGRRLASGCFAFALSSTLVGAAARISDIGEIAVNFSVYSGLVALGAAVLWYPLGLRRWSLLAGLLGLYHLYPVVALYAGGRGTSAPEDAQALVVGHVNVNFNNCSSKRFLEWVAEVEPDVLGVLEVTPFWHGVLEGLADRYPHRVFEPERLGSFRMGLLSRYPFERAAVVPTPYGGRSFVEASLRLDGGSLQVLLLHPTRPGLGWGTEDRNSLLRHVSQSVEWGPRTVVLADLNATMHSPIFADFLDSTGLNDSRRGFGWRPSWRSVKHVPGVWLDLDHIFVGSAFGVVERGVGPDVGSDHRPVWARLVEL